MDLLDNVADSVVAISEAVLNLFRRPRRLFALTALFLLGGLLAALLAIASKKALQSSAVPDRKVLLTVAAGTFAVLAASQFMLKYLRTDFEPREQLRSMRERMVLDQVLHRVSRIEEQATGLTSETRDNVVAAITAEAARTISKDFENELQKRYAPAAEAIGRASQVRGTANHMLERLQTEVRALMRRGNLNLVLGTLTTGAAATVIV